MRIRFFGQLVKVYIARVSFAAAVVSVPAFAGPPTGSITFSPLGATSVPALGTAAFILLALLLGFIGWVSMRKNGASAASSVALALAVASAGSAGGLQWLQTAEAGSLAGFIITEGTGETFPINPSTLNRYSNSAGVPLQPTSIAYDNCQRIPGPGECVVGTALAPGGSCEIDCTGMVQSDIRLKESIVRVGTTSNGLPLYEYQYRGHTGVYRGVMAQDVLLHTPEAVHLQSNGYFAVDYRMLGLELVHVH